MPSYRDGVVAHVSTCDIVVYREKFTLLCFVYRACFMDVITEMSLNG